MVVVCYMRAPRLDLMQDWLEGQKCDGPLGCWHVSAALLNHAELATAAHTFQNGSHLSSMGTVPSAAFRGLEEGEMREELNEP
jgi:hypothetical protein